MEMYTDLFNKIASSCFQKCASRKHRDQDLSLGEMTCTGASIIFRRLIKRWVVPHSHLEKSNVCITDRCVSKYLEAQQLVGAVLQKANEAQQQQQQAMMQVQQQMGG